MDLAIRIREFEYDLFMRVDANTRGHLNWFYFEIKNFRCNEEYTFNLKNFTKEDSLYYRGLKPYVRY